jgi:hypothetical protein
MKTDRIKASSVIVAKGNQLSSELRGEAVVLDLESGTYFGFNETGARIWSLVATPVTIHQICLRLQEEFDVDPAQCESAVVQLVGDMLTAGLVEVDVEHSD